MGLKQIQFNLSVRSKNGIGFILAAVFVWLIITVIFSLKIDINMKNLFMLFSTGLMFPLSVGISTLIKADWKLAGNPLGNLGLYLNLAQLIYFPIMIWAIISHPQVAIMVFAIITGAHFFPYGWFYHVKAYYIIAPIISFSIMCFYLLFGEERLWIIPLTMVFFLIFLTILLHLDYRKKYNMM